MKEKSAVRTRLVKSVAHWVAAALALGGMIGLIEASGAEAARYTVSECGWYVGHDATWYETTSSRFVRSAYCEPPVNRDAWDGVHMTGETKSGTSSIGGTQFSRWRWSAPAGTAIVNVRGQRRQTLNDHFEHRLGGVGSGGFTPFAKLASTDMVWREFSKNFSPHATAFESRLLCARVSDKRCATTKGSQAGARALTFILEDPEGPVATAAGGLTGSGWMRGTQALSFSNRDKGSGLRFAETSVDGSVRARTEHSCSKVNIGGQVRGSRMQPCALTAAGSHSLATGTLNDGPHRLRHCAIDFAGLSGCVAERTILTDNGAPAGPKELTVVGGDGWRRTNGFDLGWTVPDQGVAAPITGSRVRITGPDAFDGGTRAGTSGTGASGLTVPRPGEFRASVWLVDAAGNEREGSAVRVALRFDDVPPTGYFLEPPSARPELLRVPVSDLHSGIVSGQIAIRPEAGGEWRDLPTALIGEDEEQVLTARLPSEELQPGRWVIRARILDRAGNETVTTRRDNHSVVRIQTPLKMETGINARLAGPRGRGTALRIGYRQRARLIGTLTGIGRGGLGGQPLVVTELPRRGSRQGPWTRTVTTGRDGGFRVPLRRGAGRRITVAYAGTDRFTRASAGPFELRVGGGVTLRASPRSIRTGHRVRFRGRVGARRVRRPFRGNLVAIQYLERASGKWRPILVARTDRRGRYRAGYRFRYITGTARIRVRAVLLPAAGFPYVSAASRRSSIRVRG